MLFTEACPTLTDTRRHPCGPDLLEQAQRRVLITQSGPTDIEHVVQFFQIDGSIHAQSLTAPGGSSPSSCTSTVRVPFKTAGSMRVTWPETTPLCVSTEAGCPIWMSRAWVSAICRAAFNLPSCTTSANDWPVVTCEPTPRGTGSGSTSPPMPARTRVRPIVFHRGRAAPWPARSWPARKRVEPRYSSRSRRAVAD